MFAANIHKIGIEMKKQFFISFGLIFFLAGCLHRQESFTTMSYNIRWNSPHDGINHWDLRKNELVQQLQRYKPEIIGLQEVTKYQLDYIDSALVDYHYIGVGRDDGKEAGEYSPIFYQYRQFDPVQKGWFWLSETPETPSPGWDAQLNRICAYVCLVKKSTRDSLWVFNTHFDHEGDTARLMSAKLLLHYMDSLVTANKPIIVMGDLNCQVNDEPITVLSTRLQNCWNSTSTDNITNQTGTFNAFDTSLMHFDCIDYCFARNLTVEPSSAIIEKRSNGLWISDHFPVLTKYIRQ